MTAVEMVGILRRHFPHSPELVLQPDLYERFLEVFVAMETLRARPVSAPRPKPSAPCRAALEEIIDAIEKHGTIRIWAEY